MTLSEIITKNNTFRRFSWSMSGMFCVVTPDGKINIMYKYISTQKIVDILTYYYFTKEDVLAEDWEPYNP